MKSATKLVQKNQPQNQQNNHASARKRWVEKPPHAPIPVCSCGNKYIKTRVDQKHCLRCIYDPNVPVIL